MDGNAPTLEKKIIQNMKSFTENNWLHEKLSTKQSCNVAPLHYISSNQTAQNNGWCIAMVLINTAFDL